MIDLRATGGTPGATATNANLTTLITTDGSVVAGVPLRSDARLIMWGSGSLVANTIFGTQLITQDSIDPINGEKVSLGSASLKNLMYKVTNIPFSTGARVVGQGTNTAQTATSFGFTMDYYEGGNAGSAISGDGLRFGAKNISIAQTQGAADTVLQWYTTAFAPATQIPNGRYALLGAWASKSTGPHLLRFTHADFGFNTPGFPTIDHFGSAILGAQEAPLDWLQTDPGFQFIAISELTKKLCVPTFRVSPAGTGLSIQSLATVTTDTPVWTLNIQKLD